VVVVVDGLPQPLVARIGWLDDGGGAGLAPSSDLNLDLRVRAQVVKPGGMAIGAAVGGDQEVVLAVPGVDQGVGAGLTRTASGRAKQQRRHADHAVTYEPVTALVDLFVDAEDQAGERHGRGTSRAAPSRSSPISRLTCSVS